MSRGIIYLITNKENGSKYVGQTTQPMNKEWQKHIQEANKMSSKPIHRAMRKYGNHRFMIQEIDACDATLLNEREQYWIKHYNTYEYNTPTEQIKEVKEVKIIPKIVDRSKQQPWGSLTEKNRGDGKHSGLKIRGKNLITGICTDYESARIAAEQVTGNPNRNSNILLAAKKNGVAYGHKWQILEDKSKKKSVFGVNKKTELIEVRYESITAAIRELGETGKGTGIVKSLRNPGRYSWKGYFWFYG
jgi:group I intron endonuclease